MYHSNNMGKKRGLRCQVCTGCGLCPGVTAVGRKVNVVTVDGLKISGENIFRKFQKGFSQVSSDRRSEISAEHNAGKGKQLRQGKTRRLVTADVGTTTIAMLLYGADGTVESRYVCVNPQTAYGADVLSRISAAKEPEAAGKMRGQVLGALEEGITKFSRLLGEGEALQLVLAANTAMVYLLMGWDTEPLGRAPFYAEHTQACETVIAGAPCFVFPGVSAFVGGDIVAGMYACGMEESEEVVLLLDLGTNGEMALGNCRRRIACAAAAGPAFEGGVNKGVWGADMISLLAALRREGAMDQTGLLRPEYFEKGVRVGNVTVTQQAIRSVQLAKAAIAVGIATLLDQYGITAGEVDKVVLAGGFGYYLDPSAAAGIGLLPQELAGGAVTGGNTALTGALLAGCELLGGESAGGLVKKLERLAAGTEVVNLALRPEFQEKYVQAMEFPM